jgi:hypothetical protein
VSNPNQAPAICSCVGWIIGRLAEAGAARSAISIPINQIFFILQLSAHNAELSTAKCLATRLRHCARSESNPVVTDVVFTEKALNPERGSLPSPDMKLATVLFVAALLFAVIVPRLGEMFSGAGMQLPQFIWSKSPLKVYQINLANTSRVISIILFMAAAVAFFLSWRSSM